MQRMKIAILFLTVLLLAGCQADKVDETTSVTESAPISETTETTQPIPEAAETETKPTPAEAEPETPVAPSQPETQSPTVPETEPKRETEPESLPDEPAATVTAIPYPTVSLEDPTTPPTEPGDTWYLYQMTEEPRCFWDTAERTGETYIAPGTYSVNPWELLTTYTPTAENASITSVTDGRFVIHDGSWFLYDCYTSIREELDFVPEGVGEVCALIKDTQEIIGYTVEKDGYWGYYDLDEGRLTVDCDWVGIRYDGAGEYLIADTKADTAAQVILHRKTGQSLGSVAYGARVLAGEVTFILVPVDRVPTDQVPGDNGETPFWQIYRENLTTRISEEIFAHVTMCTDGSLIAIPAATQEDPFCRTFMVFDSQGKFIRQSESYSGVLFAEGDYIVVNRDNHLVILDREERTLAELDKWSRDCTLYAHISGWRDTLTQTGEVPYAYRFTFMEREDGEYIAHFRYTAPAGIYLLVEDQRIDEGVMGRGKWYFWSPETDTAGMAIFGSLGGYTAPAMNRVG